MCIFYSVKYLLAKKQLILNNNYFLFYSNYVMSFVLLIFLRASFLISGSHFRAKLFIHDVKIVVFVQKYNILCNLF